MPDGKVMRIDDDRGLAWIVRRGRTYEASLPEVETAARIPNARVRFKLRRSGGMERAEQITLRSGTRTSKRQRRFGDLTGSHQPGAKVMTTAQRTLGVDVTTQPVRIVEAWVQAMHDQDYDGALSLYEPSAMVHTTDGTASGRRRLRALLDTCGHDAFDPAAVELRGVDRYLRADCGGADGPTSYFFIDGGRIVEQWINIEPTMPEVTVNGLSITVTTKGLVSSEEADHARRRLGQASESITQPILFARMKLTGPPEQQGAGRPGTSGRPEALAEATLDIDGSLLRSHAAAATVGEAVDLAIHRLEVRIQQHRDRSQHKPSARISTPGEWRHGNLGSEVLPHFDRPVEDRQLVRHKSFAPSEMTFEEAAWDMALLDYDFFLFVELSTGLDTLIERTSDGELVVAESNRSTLDPIDSLLPDGWHRRHDEIPTLSTNAAIDMLNQTDAQRVFYDNVDTGRANVVYRRYDGHYGVITPPDSASEEAEAALDDSSMD